MIFNQMYYYCFNTILRCFFKMSKAIEDINIITNHRINNLSVNLCFIRDIKVQRPIISVIIICCLFGIALLHCQLKVLGILPPDMLEWRCSLQQLAAANNFCRAVVYHAIWKSRNDKKQTG